MNAREKPARTVGSGRLRASVYEHETSRGPKYRVRLSRLRTTKSGRKEWTRASSFGTREVQHAHEVLSAALDAIGTMFLERERLAGRSLKIL